MNVWKSAVRRELSLLPLWQPLAETVNQSARDKSRVWLWPVQLPAPSGTTTAIRLALLNGVKCFASAQILR